MEDLRKVTMMRRRAITAAAAATLGVATAFVVGVPALALATVVAYVLIGGGRAGWRHPQWYEPVVSGALTCASAALAANPWWQIAFLAAAVFEVLRAASTARAGEGA